MYFTLFFITLLNNCVFDSIFGKRKRKFVRFNKVSAN